jgi:WXG100 protein secretion system (Wss), protein YukD
MITVLISLDIGSRRLDLELADELAITKLMPALLDTCYMLTSDAIFVDTTNWQLLYQDSPLRPERSFADYAIVDGACLTLEKKRK